LAIKHGVPFAGALAAGPLAALLAAFVFGWFCVRLAGVYLAMLTLAFAQIVWSIAFQWDNVTGGSNGIVGVWPGAWFAGRRSFFALTLVTTGAACAAIVAIANGPFGHALRGARDSPLRAAAIGIDVRMRQWQGFMLAGAFAGFAGALFAFSKGSISPETLAIPHSIDVLVMVLLGGLNALFGPLIGAAAFTWLQDTLARATEYWRAFVGVGILVLVLAFPQGVGGAFARLTRKR
jgi:branched-chain amino acid transport system permease protein